MTSRDFCYWLQGIFEVAEPTQLDAKQTDLIKRHLNLVFKHEIDPSMGNQEHQEELNAIHHGNTDLEKLGIQHGFNVYSNVNPAHGLCPHPGWKYSSLHGWYNPKEGVPRC